MKKRNFILFGVFTITLLLTWCAIKETDNDGDSSMELLIPDQYTWVVDEEVITVNGDPIELAWNKIQLWDVLEDVTLDKIAEKFDQVTTWKISDYNWYKLIETVPSLDTPVCTLQTKQLEAASSQFPDTHFIIVSNDTPFALSRFCLANDIENVHTFSDARTREFGAQNGLFMPQYWLLARSIMIVDDNMKVVYIDYADEVTNELDIINALSYLKNILSGNIDTSSIESNNKVNNTYIPVNMDNQNLLTYTDDQAWFTFQYPEWFIFKESSLQSADLIKQILSTFKSN